MTQRLTKTALLVLVSLVVGAASAQGLLSRRPNGPAPRGALRPGLRGGAPQQAAAEDEKSTEEMLKDIPKGTNGVPTRLAFDQAPLDVLLYAYADVAGKILIPAPNLPKTQITLKTFEDRELTKEEYLEAIEVTLTMNGVVLEPFDKIFLRAFERKTVRTQGIRTSMDMPTTNSIPEKGKVVSQLIRLQHITAEEAQKALEGFKDPNGLFQVFERNNTILVTDTQENLNRMLEVVRELDVATPVTEDVFVRQIQYAAAMEIKTALETIVTESQKDAQQPAKGGAPKESGAPGFGGGNRPALQPNRLLNLNNRPGAKPEPPPSTPNATMMAQVSDADRGMIRGKVLILADERSNKLIVITAKTNMDFFDKVIETLDVETTPEVEVEVIRLKYAESEDVASMLNDLIGNGSSSSQSKNNQNANTAKNGTANRNLTQGGHANTPATRPQTANPTFSKSASSSLGELNKDNIKILADKRINGIVV
ncbi:MAG: secretin N-terminal domain-containing protein, partial [bacterium]|nr:secretin N-terminal domain-containing protein [bacterium]